MITRPFPAVSPHGDLQEVLPDVFMVTGSMKISPMRFSRNMVVVREGERLVLVNTVRLDDAGLAALDALGTVTDVVRLAGFHGSDDPFYKDRYGATVHAVKGQTYFTGVNPRDGEIYFVADAELDADSPLPLQGAKLHVITGRVAEALLLIPHGGGTLIAGDCLQNWGKADRYFNFPARIGMKLMGFLKPVQVGPEWAKGVKPEAADMRGILDLDFVNVLPAHGAAVLGDAPDRFRPTIDAYCARKG